MLYREIMTVCSQIHTKHINTLCGQNVELLNVNLAVDIVTTGLQSVNVSGAVCYLTDARHLLVSTCSHLFFPAP